MADYIYHGVGRGQLVFTDGSFVDLYKSQSIVLSTTATEGEQRGGDSPYALASWIQEKTAKLTITDAILDLRAIKAATGSDITTGAESSVFADIQTPSAGTAQLTQTANVIIDSVVCRKVADGTPLKRIASGTPEANQFVVTTAGVVTVDATITDELQFSYRYTEATGQAVHMLETDVPKNCEFRHTLITDELEDGNRYKIDVVAYRCKGTGAYEYSADRTKGFSPKIEFNVLNAGRDDLRVISYNSSVYNG